MPVLPFVESVARAQVYYFDGQRQWSDSMHFAHAEPTWTNPELTALANAVMTHLPAFQANVLSEGVTVQKCITFDLSDGEERAGAGGPPFNGGNSGSPLPPSNCMSVLQGIGRRYRGGHPRLVLSGLTVNDLQNPIAWSESAASEVAGGWTTFMAAVTATAGLGTDPVMVTVSYYLDKALRATPAVFPVLFFDTQLRVCTIRKRNGRSLGFS